MSEWVSERASEWVGEWVIIKKSRSLGQITIWASWVWNTIYTSLQLQYNTDASTLHIALLKWAEDVIDGLEGAWNDFGFRF